MYDIEKVIKWKLVKHKKLDFIDRMSFEYQIGIKKFFSDY